MTFTYRSTTVGEYTIALEQEKFDTGFYVRAYESINEWECRMINENYYCEEPKAAKRMKFLERKFRKELEV